MIRYAQEDKVHGGFYLVYAKEYDLNLKVMHSNRPELSIEFGRQVEPRIIKIF